MNIPYILYIQRYITAAVDIIKKAIFKRKSYKNKAKCLVKILLEKE